MAGSGWEPADLLSRWNSYTGRASSDSIANTVKYGFIADGEQVIIERIASIVPRILYGAPTQLTTSDGGYTFTFGTDGNGYPLFPIGKAQIYTSLSAIPGFPLRPGIDYLDEGTRIRMPFNSPWTGPLYWYGVTPSQQITASIGSVLNPPPVRLLSVLKGAALFLRSAGRNTDVANDLELELEREFGPAMTMLRTHFRGGGSCLAPLLVPWGVGPFTTGWPGVWW